MKKFEILRYLKKFSLLIFLVAFAGSVATYLYAHGKQQYTASVVIRYTNSEVKNGYTPDGTPLDVDEIYSSSVISHAMELLGSDGPLNAIRSRCSVTEILSDDQKTINDALLDKGEEVTYFPDTYKVNLVVDGARGEKYARNALDAIMQSYCTYYTEKYVEQRLSLNPSANLLDAGYDYYECIRILEDDTNDMLDFLKTKKDNYPHFRSSETGYSYADLYDIYSRFKDYVIPELYATVLNGSQVKDGEVLRNFLANKLARSAQEEAVQTVRRESLFELINTYVQKNTEMNAGIYIGEDQTVSSDYIMKQLEERGAGKNAETTYDALILEMVGIDKSIAGEKIDRAFLQEIAGIFGEVGSGSSGSPEQHAALEALIDSYEKELGEYYEIVSATGKELNLAISADYLKMISSVRVYPSVNVKMYLALAVILFLFVGCVGAVGLGRLGDLINYLLYTDKKTGLANRDRLNLCINDLAKKLLPEDFTCFVLRLDNLSEISKRFGYHVGDTLLKDFAELVSLMGDTDGMTGYNGVGNFIALFENCSEKKAQIVLKVFDEQVERYNAMNPEYPILYTAAFSTTSEAGTYEIRKLLRLATANLAVGSEKNSTEKSETGRENA